MATHSSILAWRIPWTEESGGLQSMGLQSQTRLKQLGVQSLGPVRPCLVIREKSGGLPWWL